MKSLLLFKDRDFDPQELPFNAQDLIQDLELDTLFDAMAAGDEFIREVAVKAVLTGHGNDPDTIVYRQAVLRDCLNHPALARRMYQIAAEAIEEERKSYVGWYTRESATAMARRSREVLDLFAAKLKALRRVAVEHFARVESPGLRRLFETLRRELDDAYLGRVETQLRALEFRRGVLIGARLGEGDAGLDYSVRKPARELRSLLDLIPGMGRPTYTFRLHPRDDGGARFLSDLKDRALARVANALAQATDHILRFFAMLKTEAAFYAGCVNLQEKLAQLGPPICFPVPVPASRLEHSFRGLYDVCLALTTERPVVGNDLSADGEQLAIITGANRGGKSTFLRSIGLAQLMMQASMFVLAQAFRANVSSGLFTHFKREEDEALESGKLEEEFRRMGEIADHIAPHALVLFNESFAATNEREGSQIAGQIVLALLERQIKVFYVTHQYELAHSFHERGRADAVFLRAERKADGTRTFRILEGEPLPTSYGPDLYERIFGAKVTPRSRS